MSGVREQVQLWCLLNSTSTQGKDGGILFLLSVLLPVVGKVTAVAVAIDAVTISPIRRAFRNYGSLST